MLRWFCLWIFREKSLAVASLLESSSACAPVLQPGRLAWPRTRHKTVLPLGGKAATLPCQTVPVCACPSVSAQTGVGSGAGGVSSCASHGKELGFAELLRRVRNQCPEKEPEEPSTSLDTDLVSCSFGILQTLPKWRGCAKPVRYWALVEEPLCVLLGEGGKRGRERAALPCSVCYLETVTLQQKHAQLLV